MHRDRDPATSKAPNMVAHIQAGAMIYSWFCSWRQLLFFDMSEMVQFFGSRRCGVKIRGDQWHGARSLVEVVHKSVGPTPGCRLLVTTEATFGVFHRSQCAEGP